MQNNRNEAWQMLELTIIFDQNIIDGAPAARFTRRLIELIENGYGLTEKQDHHTFSSLPAVE